LDRGSEHGKGPSLEWSRLLGAKRFVPGPGGDGSRKAEVPEGRKIFALGPRAVPSTS
jgi:hypothetical protein